MHPTSGLEGFLTRLFGKGMVVLHDRPLALDPNPSACSLLEHAFWIHRQDVAGLPVGFDRKVALRAAEVVWRASWALVHRDERPEVLLKELRMPSPPSTADQHLSADLAFRYLPQIHRRAKGIDPSDSLTRGLADLLREWPLSGVLSDLDEGPHDPPDFSEHPGLMLLYSERLARQERIAWKPGGQTLQCLELVLHERGRGRSPLLVSRGDSHD